ncbi:hypothetical protein BASA61_008508 [Batrachochytrium salamandrivorans]|nr:hypothetical protein BASA61_008508 [Batrachochytrium salamandrivorans]KAH9269874.1 hypothetical protein BASA83_008023 [Batrachochytrium salamandrivorans]
MGEWESVEPRKGSKAQQQPKSTASPSSKGSSASMSGSPLTTPLASSSPKASSLSKGAAKNRSFYAALAEVPAPGTTTFDMDSADATVATVPDVLQQKSSTPSNIPSTPTSKKQRASAETPKAAHLVSRTTAALAATPLSVKKTGSQPVATPGMEAIRNLSLDTLKAAIKTIRQQSTAHPIRDLCESIDMIVAAELNICLPLFSSKLFQLEFYQPKADPSNWRGPMPFVSGPVAQELLKYTLGCRIEDLEEGLILLARGLVEGQNKATLAGASFISTTIGHQLLIQIIAMSHPNLFFAAKKKSASKESPADVVFSTYQSSLGSNPAVGHCLLWIAAQQSTAFPDGTREPHFKGLEYWFKYFIPLYDQDTFGEVPLSPAVSSKSKLGHADRSAHTSSSVASVQKHALTYAEHLVSRLEARSSAQGKHTFVPPSITSVQFTKLLDVAFKRDTSLNKRKKVTGLQTRLHSLYLKIKNQMFSPKVPSISTDSPTQVFSTFLDKLKSPSDESNQTIVLSVLCEVIATATQFSKATSDPKFVSAEVLRSWVTLYPDYICESQILLKYLLSGYGKSHRGWFVGDESTIWTKIVYSNLRPVLESMLEANSHMRQASASSKKLPTKEKKTPGTPSKKASSSKPSIPLEKELVSTEKLIKEFLHVIPSPSPSLCSYFRTFLWMLTALVIMAFAYHTIVDVACEPGSVRSQTMCPMDTAVLHESLDHAHVWLQHETSAIGTQIGLLKDHTIEYVEQVPQYPVWQMIAEHPVYNSILKTMGGAHVLVSNDTLSMLKEAYSGIKEVPGRVASLAHLRWTEVSSSETFIQAKGTALQWTEGSWRQVKVVWHLAAIYVVDDVVPQTLSAIRMALHWLSHDAYRFVREQIAIYARRLRSLSKTVKELVVSYVSENWIKYEMSEKVTEFKSKMLQSNIGERLMRFYDSKLELAGLLGHPPRYYFESFVVIVNDGVSRVEPMLHFIWRILENDVSDEEWHSLVQATKDNASALKSMLFNAVGLHAA